MLIYMILIVLGLLLVFLMWIHYENSVLTVTKYNICSNRLPKEADGTHFVLIADLHNNQFGESNTRLIDKIDELAPNFIIIAGDLFVGREYNFDIAYDLLSKLANKYDIYYAYGIHEQKVEKVEKNLSMNELRNAKHKHDSSKQLRKIKTFREYIQKVKELGIYILDIEEAIRMMDCDKKIRIYGGSIDLDYFKRFHRPQMDCEYLNQCFGSCEEEDYQILIAHNPMYFESYVQWGADLVLSGHVHGGMVRLPMVGGVISPQMEFFPKYDGGCYSIKKETKEAKMIVSRGLGIHTIKIRLFNRPELIQVTLHQQSEN